MSSPEASQRAPVAAAKSRAAGVGAERWNLSSNDIDDQACMLPSWEQAYVQLECGRLESVVDGVSLPGNLGLFRKCTNRKLHKTFSTPAGTLAVALITADSDRISFQGHEAKAGDALLLPPGHVFDIVSHGRFDVWVATLPSSRVQAQALASAPNRRALRPEVLRSDDETNTLRTLMESMLAGASGGEHAAGTSRPLLQNLMVELEERLIDRLASSDHGDSEEFGAAQLARATLTEARRILAEEAYGVGEVPRVSDLAGRLGVSVRLLHELFRQRMGVPPRLYAQSLRLSRARADLRAARAGDVTVAEIAVRWGFWHLGRFASTYRATFGELPSESLQQ